MKRQRKNDKAVFPKPEVVIESILNYYFKQSEIADSYRKGLINGKFKH